MIAALVQTSLTSGDGHRSLEACGRRRGRGAEPYQGVGDDEGHPADEQEGAQDDGGYVLEHGVHGGLRLGGGMSELFLHILRNGGGRIL